MLRLTGYHVFMFTSFDNKNWK